MQGPAGVFVYRDVLGSESYPVGMKAFNLEEKKQVKVSNPCPNKLKG